MTNELDETKGKTMSDEQDEQDEKTQRKLVADFKEFTDPVDGRQAIALEVKEVVEVRVARYALYEVQAGDRFLRLEDGPYSEDVVFERLVPLSDAEQQLAQLVYDKTKDFTW